MKKTYTKPEIEITSFTTEDIITASNDINGMNIETQEIGTGFPIDLSDPNKWE